MKVTERGVLLTLIGLLVGATLVFAAVGGSLDGFVYPGDFLVWTAGFVVSGLLVLRARPGHAVGRLLLWAALFSAMNLVAGQVGETVVPQYAFDGQSYPSGTPLWFRVFDVTFGLGYIVSNILVVAAFARFPDGRWVTRWVAWLFWISVPLIFASNLMGTPIGAVPVVVIAVTVAVKALRSDAVYRRQVGWVLIGVGLYLAIGITSQLLPDETIPSWLVQSSVLIFPASLVLAITRYKLFELDRIVSRTVTYVVVVGVLVGVYFGLVLGLRTLLPTESPLAVALSTLAVAFAFFPLARRVQAFVDRRFFRSRYDAATVVASFASELRGTIDEAAVVGRAEAVLDEVFAPEAVGVWLARESS